MPSKFMLSGNPIFHILDARTKKMTLKGVFFIMMLGVSPMLAFGQRPNEYHQGLRYLEKHQISAQIIGPGVHYEAGLIDDITFSTAFSPGLSTHSAGANLGYAWHNRLRIYLNLHSRSLQNKSTSGNSGNYLALGNSIFFGNLQVTGDLDAPEDFTLFFNGALYGVQRTYHSGFNFDVELGLGHYQGREIEDGLGVLLNLSFGWVLTKRR